jgi:hypothetical protein
LSFIGPNLSDDLEVDLIRAYLVENDLADGVSVAKGMQLSAE